MESRKRAPDPACVDESQASLASPAPAIFEEQVAAVPVAARTAPHAPSQIRFLPAQRNSLVAEPELSALGAAPHFHVVKNNAPGIGRKVRARPCSVTDPTANSSRAKKEAPGLNHKPRRSRTRRTIGNHWPPFGAATMSALGSVATAPLDGRAHLRGRLHKIDPFVSPQAMLPSNRQQLRLHCILFQIQSLLR
jgi:hypothetical protein